MRNLKWKSLVIILLIAVIGTTTWLYYTNRSADKIPEKARLVIAEDYRRC